MFEDEPTLFGRPYRPVITTDPLEVFLTGTEGGTFTIPFGIPSEPERFDTAPYEQDVPSYLRDAIRRRYQAEIEGVQKSRETAQQRAQNAVRGFLATSLPQATFRAFTGAPTRDASSEQIRSMVQGQLQRMQELQEQENRLGAVLPEEANIRIQEARANAERYNKQLRMEAEQNFLERQAQYEEVVGDRVARAAQSELDFAKTAYDVERQQKIDDLNRRYKEKQIDYYDSLINKTPEGLRRQD